MISGGGAVRVARPYAVGRRWIARTRVAWATSQISARDRAQTSRYRCHGGGKRSKASQEVSTSRPMRSGLAAGEDLRHRAAGVVADERHVIEVEGGDQV